MTELKTLTDMNDLDLSDPAVAEMVTAANVDSRPVTAEVVVLDERLSEPAKAASRVSVKPSARPTGKGTPFTMTLSTEEVAGLIRQAGASNISWKEFLKQQIHEQILLGKVGRAVISQPSTMKDKVSGYQGGIVRRG